MKTQILKKQVIKIFQKFGLSKDHALISSNALINAELVGAYGHGLSRLKMYCDRTVSYTHLTLPTNREV